MSRHQVKGGPEPDRLIKDNPAYRRRVHRLRFWFLMLNSFQAKQQTPRNSGRYVQAIERAKNDFDLQGLK